MNDEEVRSAGVVLALLEFQSAESAMRRRTAESIDMGSADLRALQFLLRAQSADRAVSGRELADHLGMTSASVSALLDRLTTSGNVERTRDPANRRSNLVTATREADDQVRETLGGMHDRVSDVIGALSEADAKLVLRFLASMTLAVGGIDAESA